MLKELPDCHRQRGRLETERRRSLVRCADRLSLTCVAMQRLITIISFAYLLLLSLCKSASYALGLGFSCDETVRQNNIILLSNFNIRQRYPDNFIY